MCSSTTCVTFNHKIMSLAQDIKEILAQVEKYKQNSILKLPIDDEFIFYAGDHDRTLCLEIEGDQARLSVESHPHWFSTHLTTDAPYIKWLIKNRLNLWGSIPEDKWYNGKDAHYYTNDVLRHQFYMAIKKLYKLAEENNYF